MFPEIERQAHSPKTDLHGTWKLNMVLIEDTLNLPQGEKFFFQEPTFI